MKEDLTAATQDVKMKEAEKATPEKRSVFEIFFEVMGWMRIVASPLIVGIVIGFIVYINSRNLAGMLAGICIATVGLIIGMTWATRVWKKHGTIHFVSRLMATPELDNPEEKIDKPGK